MNRTQRIARFNLLVVLVAVGLSALTVGILYIGVGLPMRLAAGGFGLMGISGLMGLSPVLFRKQPGGVDFDERDLLIQRKAVIGAYSIFWVLFVLAAMIPFFVRGVDGQVSVKYLAGMVGGGMVAVTVVQSVITLEQYGWRDKDHE